MAGTTGKKTRRKVGSNAESRAALLEIALLPEHHPGGRWAIYLSDDGSLPGQTYIAGFELHGRERFASLIAGARCSTFSLDASLRFATEADADAWRLGHLKDFEPYNPVVVNLDTLGVP